MNKNTRTYKRDLNIIAKKIGDEYIVIEPSSETFYTFNETGEIILQYLHTWRSVSQIAKKVFDSFDTSEKNLEDDIELFLNQLAKKKLIVAKV